MGNLLEQFSENPKIHTTVTTSGGGVANIRYVENDECEIGTTQAGNAWKAYNSIDPFEEKIELRALIAGEQSPYMFIVLENSDITSISKVSGKRISPGHAGGGTNLILRDVLSFLDIEYDESDIVFMPHGEGKDALADGKIDVWFTFYSAWVDALANSKNIRVLSFSESDIDIISQQRPYFSATVFPANTIEKVPEEVRLLSVPSIWVCKPEFDESLAYQIVKIIVEHGEVIQQSHRNSRMFDANFAANSSAIPYHDGALKYYREVGAIK
jgi:TRAP transporter TAXI family solute receptor